MVALISGYRSLRDSHDRTRVKESRLRHLAINVEAIVAKPLFLPNHNSSASAPRCRVCGCPPQTGPTCRSDVMTLGKIFGILIFSSLAATGATLVVDISNNLTNLKTWPTLNRRPTSREIRCLRRGRRPRWWSTMSSQKRRSSWGATSACITKPSCIT
jgi:hypothetical protein